MQISKLQFKIKNWAGFLVLVIVLISISLFLILRQRDAENTAGSLDSFAQCLAAKGITMYGADWCPHCQNEKKAFGKSFRIIPYVECPDDPKLCLAAGIAGYPTWIFPASPAGGPDGKKLVGEQGIKKLAEESGCSLPQ